MIVTTICRIFFHWYEYQEIIKFEKENPNFKKIHVDTDGVTYEYRTDYVKEENGGINQ